MWTNRFYIRVSIEIIFLIFLSLPFFFFNSCQKEIKPKCKDCLILYASLDEKIISLDSIFDKIELIPLETIDNSLIRYFEKYDFFEGKHYILDNTQSILFIFDEKGNYISRIARIGQGPGEYRLIYDFSLNRQKGQIEMLSPHKFIYCYNLYGSHYYIKTYDLTSISPSSIQRMQILDDNNYIIWSPPMDGHNGINIISQETGKLKKSFWQDLFFINKWASDVFYTYNNEVFFSLNLYNTVYKVTEEGVEAAYEWNFGKETVDISRHKISTGMYNYNKDVEVLEDKLGSSIILYECMRNYQNNKYYYVQLRFKREYDKHLFYNKKTGESCFFENSVENYRFDPILYFADEYMIGILNYDDKDKLINCSLLDDENKQKLLSFKEDDNSYLIKYYFKENKETK